MIVKHNLLSIMNVFVIYLELWEVKYSIDKWFGVVLDIGTDQKVFKILIFLMSNDAFSFPKLCFNLSPLFFYNVLNLASLVAKF